MDDIKNVVRIEKTRVIKDYSVGIYARVSTNSKEQLDSLANQISGLTRLASAHRTWFVADIFIDVGTAKTGSTREEFNRMIRECENGHIDIVLTKSISRFGRDTVETLEAVRKIKDAGKRIIFERDKIDTETVDSELLLSMIEVCEQTENEWRSENIRIGLKQRAANGTSGLYDRPCYGYYIDWYLEGASAVGIKKQLESKQIKSPKGKDTWSKHTIESILTNMKYTGDVAIADSGGSGNRYKLGDHHTGIISKEKFEAVQIERAMRSNMERTEEGWKRRSTKYSSKRKK